jgi:glycosyltransferase involved in cell wall biosynthesis
MIKIVINNPRTSYFTGGAEMVSIEHAKNMCDFGNDVSFFTIDPSSVNQKYSEQYFNFKQKYKDKISFIELKMEKSAMPIYLIDPGENRARWNTESLFYNRRLFSTIADIIEPFDFMLSYFNLDALIIPKNKIKQNVLYLCGVPSDESRFRTSFLAMYDKIIAITNETRNYWQKYSEHHISVIKTGVDTKRFMPKPKENIIVFIGRLIERKGCDVFLKAISQLKERDSLGNYRAVIIGDGPQTNKLQKLAERLKIKNFVKFIGLQNNPEKFLAKAKICVFPSKNGEGLQGVILESMASGACVLASDSKINQELFSQYGGVIIDDNNFTEIANQIQYFIKNQEETECIGRNARRYVEKYYDWQTAIKHLLQEISV